MSPNSVLNIQIQANAATALETITGKNTASRSILAKTVVWLMSKASANDTDEPSTRFQKV